VQTADDQPKDEFVEFDESALIECSQLMVSQKGEEAVMQKKSSTREAYGRVLVKLGTGAYKERFLQDWDYCLKHFDVLELQDFIMPDNLDNSEIIDEYLGMLSGFNGEITLHGPYLNLAPTSIDNKVKEVAELRYLQAVEAANKFGADQLVIHSFYDTTTGYSKYDELWLQGNRQLPHPSGNGKL
jgi:hypothetical protein